MSALAPKFETSPLITPAMSDPDFLAVWVAGSASANGGNGGYIGRVWKQVWGCGWSAYPVGRNDEAGSWDSFRRVCNFATEREACLFLYGVAHAGDGSTAVPDFPPAWLA